MAIELSCPDPSHLDEVVEALRAWQREDAPVQLHPGDLGWAWQQGAEALAASVRTWSEDGDVVAIGFLDGPDTLRLTVSPTAWSSEDVARRIVADASDPRRGVLPAGAVAVEVPDGTRVGELLAAAPWSAGESWTPLRLDLGRPVADAGLHVEVVTTQAQVADCTAVHRSAWDSPRFTDERWRAVARGLPFSDARCLLARDATGAAVATLTVWSAGPGRPGLVEPLGVHADHRRRGHGASICRAAGHHLKDMGATSAWVCTPSSLHAAVATYEAAGFERMPPRLDLARGAATAPQD